MPKKHEYVVPDQQVKDFQTAYDGLMEGKDILDKMRIAGQPKADAEARNKAAIEANVRWCEAFGIKLDK